MKLKEEYIEELEKCEDLENLFCCLHTRNTILKIKEDEQ